MPQVHGVSPNAQQIEYWNSAAGDTWAQLQEPLDRQIEPLSLAAIDVLDPAKSEHIIDIGCGCGQSSLTLAARVGPTGSVVGIDISSPMLVVAQRRAPHTRTPWCTDQRLIDWRGRALRHAINEPP